MSRRLPWLPLSRAWLVPIVAASVAACGGDWDAYAPNLGALPDDTGRADPYPSGPYGTRIGDKMTNLVFAKALFDPGTFCKPARELDLGQAEGLRTLSLDAIRRGSAFCPDRKKRFLWLIASAGW